MERYTIDRMLETCAVCIAGDGTVRRIPLSDLPAGADEGVVLACTDEGYAVDEEMTAYNRSYMDSEYFYEHEASDPEGRDAFGGLGSLNSPGESGSFGGAGGGFGAPGGMGFGGPGAGGAYGR